MLRRKKIKSLKICFMGGNQAGIIGALALFSKGYRIIAAVSYFNELSHILAFFKVPVYSSINDKDFLRALGNSDILVSVHGREIFSSDQLRLPKFGCINVHPYLYRYKGTNPVGRALKDKNFKGSVGVHRMELQVDSGEIIVEEFVDTRGAETIDAIYNRLYPYYCIALLKVLDIISKENKIK